MEMWAFRRRMGGCAGCKVLGIGGVDGLARRGNLEQVQRVKQCFPE